MSKTTKRKHVLKEILNDDYELPLGNQSIVKLLSSKGNNLHEVEAATGEQYLVSMPTKFRKNIWVKRGDFLLVEPIIEGDKVKAEIVKILNADLIKYYKESNVWPEAFSVKKNEQEETDELFVNTNRVTVDACGDSDSSDDSNDADGTSESDNTIK